MLEPVAAKASFCAPNSSPNRGQPWAAPEAPQRLPASSQKRCRNLCRHHGDMLRMQSSRGSAFRIQKHKKVQSSWLALVLLLTHLSDLCRAKGVSALVNVGAPRKQAEGRSSTGVGHHLRALLAEDSHVGRRIFDGTPDAFSALSAQACMPLVSIREDGAMAY